MRSSTILEMPIPSPLLHKSTLGNIWYLILSILISIIDAVNNTIILWAAAFYMQPSHHAFRLLSWWCWTMQPVLLILLLLFSLYKDLTKFVLMSAGRFSFRGDDGKNFPPVTVFLPSLFFFSLVCKSKVSSVDNTLDPDCIDAKVTEEEKLPDNTVD